MYDHPRVVGSGVIELHVDNIDGVGRLDLQSGEQKD